jgi:predicted  nucleic acid-binding Zn-ribbon protein
MTSHHDKIEQITERLEEWDYKVDRLESRVKSMPDEMRTNALEKFQKIKDYQQSLQHKEQELKEAAEHAIDDIESAFDEIWDTFKLLFEEVDMEVEVEGL